MRLTNDIILQEFYGWWQLAVCSFAFAALLSIWWHIGKKQNDFGQVWLALSVLCWGISGAVEIYYAQQLMEQNLPDKMPLSLGGWRSILSLCNSLFILLALPWFKYIPERITSLVKSDYWYYIIGLPFVFSLIPMLSTIFFDRSYKILSELDLYYAFFTLVFLAMVLFESFEKRRLRLLAWLSVVCILITLAGQLLKLWGNEVNLMLFAAVFKTCLIMLFFALALSWVKDLVEDQTISAARLKLQFSRTKNSNGKFEQKVRIQGLPGMIEKTIVLTPALYQLFRVFAEKKGQSDPWLEIKPKSEQRSGKTYDIQDHNEIKRLLNALLDGIYGKGAWSNEKHAQPLKLALFQFSDKRDRKIKLNIPSEHISLK